MRFYELVFLTRPDISSVDVDKITDGIKNALNNSGGEVLKEEYWGLRVLEYQIENYKKAHYVLLGISANATVLAAMRNELRILEQKGELIRFALVNVEKINQDPSPVLLGKHKEQEHSVDVTAKV